MTTEALNKSDLIERISLKNPHLAEPLVEEAVKIMIDQMIEALSTDNRIEIRGLVALLYITVNLELVATLKLVSQLMLQQRRFRTLNQVKHYVMQ